MFTHLNKKQFPHMVNISKKKIQRRKAQAQSVVSLDDEIVACFSGSDIQSKKGSVFAVSIVAGIQAIKDTSRIIPLCHNIPISGAEIDIELHENHVKILCSVSSDYATGVEMEALLGASIAAITVYDMCKSIHSNIIIKETKLLFKEKKDMA